MVISIDIIRPEAGEGRPQIGLAPRCANIRGRGKPQPELEFTMPKVAKARKSVKLDDSCCVPIVRLKAGVRLRTPAAVPLKRQIKASPKSERWLVYDAPQQRAAELAMAYNRRAIAHGWQTWAIVSLDRELRKVHKVTRAANATLQRITAPCYGRPIRLYARRRMFDSPSFELSAVASITSVDLPSGKLSPQIIARIGVDALHAHLQIVRRSLASRKAVKPC